MKARVTCSLILVAVATQFAANVRADPKSDLFDAYKAARQAEQAGEIGRAVAGYETTRTNSPALRKYADRRLALIARSTGSLMLERILLLRSRMQPAGDRAAVTRRLAHNAFEAGNYAETVTRLTAASTQSGTASRDDQSLLAYAYFAEGDATSARTLFAALIASRDTAVPDDAAIMSARSLDRIDTDPLAIPEEDHLRRAAVYQANREFEAARKHYKAVVDASPGGPATPDCLLQIGRGYAQSSDPAEAVNWFERVLEQYPSATAAKDALLQAASMYSRVGKPKEAIKRYQRFIDLYPTSEKVDRAYLNLVDVTRDQGEDHEALKWCEKTEAAFVGKPPAAVAIFAAARIHFARGDASSALVELDRLKDVGDLGRGIPGGAERTEIDLLRGIGFEKLGRFQEAVDAYLSVPGAFSYYGSRADERLRGLSDNDAARGFVDQKAGAFASALRAKDSTAKHSAAVGILRLSHDQNLRNSALDELKHTLKFPPAKPPQQGKVDATEIKLAALGLGDDIYPEGAARHSFSVAESAFHDAPDLPVDVFANDDLRNLYPIAYGDSVRRSAALYGVDPRFVLAIMRQESGFDPFAHSGAAARGLMQLIMTTAATTAAQTGRSSVTEDDLFDTATSIDLGTRHIADLFRIFPEQPEAVAAAYNAGDDNAKRWVARAKSNSPDAYVPEIMYVQTKDYVAKVMTNYRIYQLLYAEDLTAR